ncbi:MAG: RNA methyltransferase [Acidobacteria bacterium]|nr:RNA methyltransferase [Acidobacteriota bacterium]
MIRSRNNPQVRALRRLRNAHTRKQSDLLLLEGRHLVDAAATARLTFRHLLATPDFRAAHMELIRRLEHRSGTAAALIDPDRLREQADADAPQGIAALVEPPAGWHSAEGETLVLPSGLHLYVDGVQDPGNLGAMARSAEAAGAAAGTARPSQPRALRASAGSLLRIPVWTDVRVDHVQTRITWLVLAAQGNKDGASLPVASLFTAETPDPKVPADLIATDAILAVGNESKGLSRPVLDRADMALWIPTARAVESLNAAVAASLALFELQRLRGEFRCSRTGSPRRPDRT